MEINDEPNNEYRTRAGKMSTGSGSISSSSALFSEGRIHRNSTNTSGSYDNSNYICDKLSNLIFTKRRPIILKRGRNSWPVANKMSSDHKNVRQTCRGSAGNAESMECRKRNSECENISRRDSFLYRSESIKARFQKRPSSTKSILSCAEPIIKETDEVVVTPYAQILLTLKGVKEKLQQIFTERRKVIEGIDDCCREVVTLSSKDTLSNLEWCLYQLENIQTHRAVSNLASDKFKRLLSQELVHNNSSKNLNGKVSQYICQTFTERAMEMEGESGQCEVSEDNCKDQSAISPIFTEGISTDGQSTTEEMATFGDPVDSELFKNENWKSNVDLCPDLITISSNVCSYDEKYDWLTCWSTDIFELARLHQGNLLYFIAMEIIKERNLIQALKMDAGKLSKFIRIIESKYRPSVKYHNSMHAADVTLSANVILSTSSFRSVFSDLEIFAVIFAAVIHDVNHPGVTNQFLINTNNQLAILYNDNSVLENHHLATAFSVLRTEDCDFMNSFTVHQKQMFRRMIIDMVLATDMSKHMTMLAGLKTTVETKKVSGIGVLSLDNYNDRIQIMESLLHCADLSNPTKPLRLYTQWIELVMEEFFSQGDQERQLDIDISPMCDRESATVPRSQVSFIDFIVYPLWEAWAELVQPAASEMLANIHQNKIYYENLVNKENKSNNNKTTNTAQKIHLDQ